MKFEYIIKSYLNPLFKENHYVILYAVSLEKGFILFNF